MVIFAGPDPAVVGHRGAPREVAENTLASFLAAIDRGADWVELDARRCADGVVVHHDAVTSDGTPVVEQSLAELAARGIPTLHEVLTALPTEVGIDIELKNLPGEPDYDEAEQRLGDAVAELVAGDRGRPLLVSSFNPEAVEPLRGTGVGIGLLTTGWMRLDAAVRVARELGFDVVCPHDSSPGLADDPAAAVAEAHGAGLELLVWTVDDPQRARELAAAGVDAICTNDPAAVAEVLRRRS